MEQMAAQHKKTIFYYQHFRVDKIKENKICFPKGQWLIKILDSVNDTKTGQANTQLVLT